MNSTKPTLRLKCQLDDRPYRLIVSVIRGTNAGRALQLMASGIRCYRF
jgi:hypothetical protein